LRLTESIENLDSLPGRPKHFRIWIAIKEAYRGWMVHIPPILVTQPPRRVGVIFHLLSDAKNAAPSNFERLGLPMARCSASFRVILGLWLLLTINLGFPFDITISCLPSANPSARPAL